VRGLSLRVGRTLEPLGGRARGSLELHAGIALPFEGYESPNPAFPRLSLVAGVRF
jgi:hypothetical protein